jgi:hypothetical protein
VLISENETPFVAPALAARVEPIEPKPAFSLWTDQFNNLIDVLKVRPLDGLKALLDFN